MSLGPLYVLLGEVSFRSFALKNPASPVQKNLCIPMIKTVLFTIAKIWIEPKCPSVNEWIKKLWSIHTMEYYAAERKKEFLSFGER